MILVEWNNGTVSYIESGWWQPHMDGPEAATQLYGTKGVGQLFPTQLEIPNAKEQKLELVQSGFLFPRAEHCPQSMYDTQMAHFIHCIRRNKTPSPGAMAGLVNMQVVDAAFKSARTGKAVFLK